MPTLDITPLKGSKLKTSIDISEELSVLGDGESVPINHGCFRIMHPDIGDERITWDKSSLLQIRDAKELFIKFIKEGLTPYRVGTNGKASSEVMDEFDAAAEEVIFLPVSLCVGG